MKPACMFARTLQTAQKTLLLAFFVGAAGAQAQVSLYTAVDLALRNSNAVRMAQADRQRASATLAETRDAYIPSLSIGGGPGYSYGFPIGTPTLFNVSSNSLLFNFSQKDYIRSSKSALKAATFSLRNARQQVILDTTLDYVELNKTIRQIAALGQALGDSAQLISIVNDRVAAGLDSRVEATKAQLTQARIHLRQIQLQDHADELRKHLAGLTGLDAASIAPSGSSIPKLPDFDLHSALQPAPASPGVQAAAATADSKMFAAFGDRKQNRPNITLAFQYARFSNFNGYQQYYKSFQANNIAIGIQAVWPLFDPVRTARANESKAVAAHARSEAQQTKIQFDERNAASWHALRELEAQEQVADLQQQLTKDTLAATLTEMNQGGGTANAPPVTPKQAETERVDERIGYADLLDAQFNVTRAKLDLLRMTGTLESWVKTQPSNTAPQQIQIIPASPTP